jgi:hypothetical protein
MKRLLVHICCGPCSIYPLKSALSADFDVWGYFHNPNIQPAAEFSRRLEAVRKLSSLMNLNVLYDDYYSASRFVKDAAGRPLKTLGKSDRCGFCYSTRIEATAKAARENGFDAFTTSLLYSRHQDHERIRGYAESVAEKHGVEFYYRDFRAGWQNGIAESKAMGLYRQQYCGCIYSWMERYGKGAQRAV